LQNYLCNQGFVSLSCWSEQLRLGQKSCKFSKTLPRVLTFFFDCVVCLLVLKGELGATVWDCALVVIQAFASKKDRWQSWFAGKRVLDMSCGTGAVGIAVGKMFAVSGLTLTDLPCLIPLIEKNVAKNEVCAFSLMLWLCQRFEYKR
jgi:hypothetical protein